MFSDHPYPAKRAPFRGLSPPGPGRFHIWAHRGYSAVAPENTLAAFRAAETAGADGIELDIQLSRDGIPVVLHDETVDRTTDGRGTASDFTLPELRELDAGFWFDPAFAGEPLPSLEEVLAWAEGRLRLNLEIKAAAAGRAILDLLPSFPRVRLLISSFDHSLLESLHRARPELPLGFLLDSYFWRRALGRATACGAESLNPRHDRLSRPLLAACRKQGLAVYPWTIDDPRQAVRLWRQGVSGVFTNDPAAIGRAMSRF